VYPSEARFREIFDTLEAFIERKYGIPVVISDVVSPFTGDLDGAEIRVDYDLPAEEAVFIIAHLFGHTVQWNLSAEARDLGARVQANPTEQQIERLYQYERTACRYSLRLLHEAGIRDVDAWLSDFAACDFEYLTHFYRTGEKRPFRSFWKEGAPPLEPLAIPEFHPTRWVSRWEGIVV
jgi:hypothetical protein